MRCIREDRCSSPRRHTWRSECRGAETQGAGELHLWALLCLTRGGVRCPLTAPSWPGPSHLIQQPGPGRWQHPKITPQTFWKGLSVPRQRQQHTLSAPATVTAPSREEEQGPVGTRCRCSECRRPPGGWQGCVPVSVQEAAAGGSACRVLSLRRARPTTTPPLQSLAPSSILAPQRAASQRGQGIMLATVTVGKT